MENKQMIHIASEIIVLGGLIYYFNQKNKKLLSHIQDLSRKIEDQEGILQKHEEIIRKMSEFINQQKNTSIEKTKKTPVKEIRTITPKKSEPIKVSFKPNTSPIKNKIAQRVEEISSSEEEEEEEEESDLDAELEEELQELEIEEIEIEKLSLKKKN